MALWLKIKQKSIIQKKNGGGRVDMSAYVAFNVRTQPS